MVVRNASPSAMLNPRSMVSFAKTYEADKKMADKVAFVSPR